MKKTKKKKLNKKRIILFILIIMLTIYLWNKFIANNNVFYDISQDLANLDFSNDYKVIKQDINKNYSGKGQERAKDKDGYFTTFTTENNHKKTYIEYKQNSDSSWKNNEYWGRYNG